MSTNLSEDSPASSPKGNSIQNSNFLKSTMTQIPRFYPLPPSLPSLSMFPNLKREKEGEKEGEEKGEEEQQEQQEEEEEEEGQV